MCVIFSSLSVSSSNGLEMPNVLSRTRESRTAETRTVRNGSMKTSFMPVAWVFLVYVDACGGCRYVDAKSTFSKIRRMDRKKVRGAEVLVRNVTTQI